MADPVYIALAAVAFLLAGAVKGAAGMGLPTTSVSLMTLALDPRTAIALLLVPMIATNAWQIWRSGEILRTCRTYFPFALTLRVGVGITVLLAKNASDHALMALLGGTLLIFVIASASRWAPSVPASFDTPAQAVTGMIAGVMGGLTSVWAPPLAVYLAARRVSKDEFVRACGLLIFLGSLPLALGYLRLGFLTPGLFWTSVLLLVPAFAGFAVGERVRHRLSENGFRRFLLVMFALMGLNLIRRAVF